MPPKKTAVSRPPATARPKPTGDGQSGDSSELASRSSAEYLPAMLIGLSCAVDEVGGPESEALEELRTAVGVALAAAERLRAERRWERSQDASAPAATSRTSD